jgi:hypothetical protein
MTSEGDKGMSRRGFLKVTAVGALALTSVPTIIIPRRTEAYQAGGAVHPNVDPLRVVGVRDPSMSKQANPRTTWEQEEQLVNWQPVHDNIDRLAMGLAEEKSAADAWKKIFVKPANKGWGDVVVAIKTNQIAEQRPRSAVMSKVCHVLTDVLGVKGANVHIYDACHGSGMAKSNPFKGLPEGVHIADQWGGYNSSVQVPAPYLKGQRQARCLDHLAKDEVDILVNIALCKGHGSEFGGFTLSMKNHYGTFDPGPSHRGGGNADYLIGINKSAQILGRMDAATGNVLFPRQQLVVVDALWASNPGPGDLPDSQPNTILMGTFGPVVDYLGAMRFRKDLMHWPVNEQVANRFLTDFGLTESSLPNGGKIVDVSPKVA